MSCLPRGPEERRIVHRKLASVKRGFRHTKGVIYTRYSINILSFLKLSTLIGHGFILLYSPKLLKMGNSLEFSTPCFQLASPTLVLAVLLGATILYISYINFTTSLRRIPGPFLAKYSKLWLVHVTRQRKRHFHDIELHEKYGPIVRVSPTQVSLASPQAVKIVYGTVSNFLFVL